MSELGGGRDRRPLPQQGLLDQNASVNVSREMDMSNAPDIDVLLACYNAGAYLEPLLASLEAQTNRGFRLLVRDDGSCDGTAERLAVWAAARPGWVEILEDGQPTGSAVGNFNHLLARSRGDYLLFADQDDVWHPRKVEHTVARLMQLEAEFGAACPLLTFCDLALVDSEGRSLHPSFRDYQGIDVKRGRSFHRLLMENVVTGCAMGINAAARDGAGTVPRGAIMHDWWLALYCAAFGSVDAMPETLIDYRQHGGNAVGAVAWSPVAAISAQLGIGTWRRSRRAFQAWLLQLIGQASAFQGMFGDRLGPTDRERLAAFTALLDVGSIARRWSLWRYGFRMARLIRTTGVYLRI